MKRRKGDKQYMHLLLQPGFCTTCHNPHGNSSTALLNTDGDAKALLVKSPFVLGHFTRQSNGGLVLIETMVGKNIIKARNNAINGMQYKSGDSWHGTCFSFMITALKR